MSVTQESPPTDVPPRLRDERPTVKWVYDKLAQHEPATQTQLARQMQMPQDTVRRALNTLEDRGEVTSQRDYGDIRKKYYERQKITNDRD